MSPVFLRVRDFREKRGLSQRELSRLTGLSQKTISAIETNKSKGVDFDTLDRLAAALGVEPALLIVREAAPPTPIDSGPSTKRGAKARRR
jgi:transcriptional regulator with XRE-family HTH domain